MSHANPELSPECYTECNDIHFFLLTLNFLLLCVNDLILSMLGSKISQNKPRAEKTA